MGILIAFLTLVLVAVVVLVVSAPLRAAAGRALGHAESSSDLSGGGERAELEAARETKYREIRDAELDYRTGKLSRADFEAIDGELRGEAIEILNRLEAGES